MKLAELEAKLGDCWRDDLPALAATQNLSPDAIMEIKMLLLRKTWLLEMMHVLAEVEMPAAALKSYARRGCEVAEEEK